MTENDEEKVQKPSFLTDNEFPSMIVKNVSDVLKDVLKDWCRCQNY